MIPLPALISTVAQIGLPVLARALGSDTIAGEAVTLMSKALGVEPTPEAVSKAIQDDPQVAIAKLRAAETEAAARWQALSQIALAEADRVKAAIADTADARARDIAILKLTGRASARPNIMLICAFLCLIVIVVGVILYRKDIPGEVLAILNTVAGGLMTLIGLAFNFEFGSSAGSQSKDLMMGNLIAQAQPQPPAPLARKR